MKGGPAIRAFLCCHICNACTPSVISHWIHWWSKENGPLWVVKATNRPIKRLIYIDDQSCFNLIFTCIQCGACGHDAVHTSPAAKTFATFVSIWSLTQIPPSAASKNLKKKKRILVIFKFTHFIKIYNEGLLKPDFVGTSRGNLALWDLGCSQI